MSLLHWHTTPFYEFCPCEQTSFSFYPYLHIYSQMARTSNQIYVGGWESTYFKLTIIIIILFNNFWYILKFFSKPRYPLRAIAEINSPRYFFFEQKKYIINIRSVFNETQKACIQVLHISLRPQITHCILKENFSLLTKFSTAICVSLTHVFPDG